MNKEYEPKKVQKAYDVYAKKEATREKSNSLRIHIPRKIILDNTQENHRVLDAGCGTGMNALAMLKKGVSSVTLLDISDEILQKARETTKEFLEKTEYIKKDISNLEGIEDKIFDLTVCVGDAVSYTLEKRQESIKELCRVTKKGGTIIIGCDSLYGHVKSCLDRKEYDKAKKLLHSRVLFDPSES